MDEQPPLTPRRRHGRPRPSASRLAVRRVGAIALLVAGLAIVGWLVRGAFDDDIEERRATPTPSPAKTAVRVPPKPLRVIFPEGFTRRQMAQRITAVNGIARRKRGVRPRLSARGYLRVTAATRAPKGFAEARKRRSLEGFLFPATYEFDARTTSRQLVADQLETFARNWRKVDLRYARSKNLTPYDVLVIASMIEEEVRAPEERRLVAGVIYNRLKAGMRLGIDATIRYGLNVPPTESLRLSHLNHPTPYNTRQRTGLPPTPITNPGLASLRAAARPARTNYLFFVRKPDKVHHFFTASEEEFDAYREANGY